MERTWMAAWGRRSRNEPRRGRRLLPVVVSVALVALLGACSPHTATPTAGSLRVIFPSDVTGRSGDPAVNGNQFAAALYSAVYSGLYEFDPHTGAPVEALAVSDTVSSDQLTHTFKLRDGVKFHDGSTVTAEDVKFSLDRARGQNPDLPTPSTAFLFSLMDTIEAPDASTVVLKLKSPDPILHNRLASRGGMILSKSYVERVGQEGFWQAPIGTGPYKVASESPGNYIDLVKFDAYWGASKANIDNVRIKFVTDAASAINQLRAGDADFITAVDPSQVDPLRSAGFTVTAIASGTNVIMTFDLALAKFQNPKVRVALNMAVDRASIVKNIFYGTATEIATMDNSVATIDPDLKPYPYDPERAKQMLIEAGFDFSQPITIAAPPHYLKSYDVVAVMASDLQKIGIDFQIHKMDQPTWLTHLTAGDFVEDTTLTAPNNDYRDAAYSMAFVTSCRSSLGISQGACDPGLEAHYDAMNTVSGPERVTATQELDRYVYENPPAIMLFQLPQINAMRSGVTWTPVAGEAYVRIADLTIS